MLLTIVVTTTLLVMVLLTLYLRHIPEDVMCPRCGTLTGRSTSWAGATGRILDRWTVVRHCVVCPWQGRVRASGESRVLHTEQQSRRSA